MIQTVTENDILNLKSFLDAGKKLGIEFPDHLTDKLAKLDDKDGRIKVALVGGFSVGKTSLAAAWLGKAREDMKISQAESSNAVTVYDIEDNIQLIDTPGLFGFKEKGIEGGEVEAYREITRKYVSEADLLLYVLNPSNPLKESHQEELNWLFRDLNLLPRTVFVIGSFDQVADLEDDESFDENLAIKKENIIQRLKDLIGLTDEEQKSLSVVAISANPFDEGHDYWAQHPEEFRKLSHIGDLQKATSQQLERAGGAEAVKANTALSIVRDVVQRQMIPAQKMALISKGKADAALEKTKEEGPRLGRYQREIMAAQRALRTWVLDYFTDLIVEAKNTGEDAFGEFYLRNLGDNGSVLAERVQLRFEEELGPISDQIVEMGIDFLASDSDWSWLGTVGQGATSLGKSGVISGKTILATRDALGLSLKFKPWGALKLASKANIALTAAGPIIEGALMLKKWHDRRKFLSTRETIASALQEQRDELLKSLNSSNFIEIYFPQLIQMQDLFENIRREAETARQYAEQIKQWVENGRNLCKDFGIQPPRISDNSKIIDV
ncbi:MAG: LeoA/HP0731 family dynamin-like GTPase [Acetobacter malorum]|uniref:LeoA/HP0731 family dynamin-like GTPase n=1 Tax=Acetobacter malorum TaxID=178901 RepID=UPI0039E99601